MSSNEERNSEAADLSLGMLLIIAAFVYSSLLALRAHGQLIRRTQHIDATRHRLFHISNPPVSTALSQRDKITIANTITGYISNIPIHMNADFSSMTRALELLKDEVIDDSANSDINERINSINDYMAPDFNAVRPEQRSAFVSLCHQIIDDRIQFFENLTPKNKLDYITDQQIYRNKVAMQQEQMSRRHLP